MSEFDYYWEKAEFQDKSCHQMNLQAYMNGHRISKFFDDKYEKEAIVELRKIIPERFDICRKIYADVYIDDLSFNHRPFELRFEKSFETVLQEYVDAGYSVKITETTGGTIKIALGKNGKEYRHTLFRDVVGYPVEEEEILFWLRDCKYHLDRALEAEHEKTKNLNG